MSFIEEFYFGNIDPQLRNVKENTSFKQDTQNKQKVSFHPAYPENARKSELKLQFFLRLKNASNLESAIF